jgi:hypothetical protein
MLEPVIPHRLEAQGSVSSLDLRGVHAFAGSGAARGASFTGLRSSSLGSSPLSFERAANTAAMIVAFGSTATFSVDPHLTASLVPQTIEVPGEAATRTEGVAAEERAAVKESIVAISRELDDAAIEDGVSHRAEQLISTHVAALGEAGLLYAVRSNESPARAAAFLRLLGRSSSLSSRLRGELVSWAIASASVEVRDAAVQAVENWADRTLAKQLRAHAEPIGWLHHYAANVVRDLEA